MTSARRLPGAAGGFALAAAIAALIAPVTLAQTALTNPGVRFLDRLRPLDATATSVSRSETTVDVGALWMKPLSRKLLLTLSGGPSFVSYAQDVVTALALDELYPYDSVGLSRAITVERDGTAIGGFGSGEVYYTITRQFAVGGGARFSRAADDVETGTDQFVSIKTGGLQVGGGVRFLF